MFGTAVGHVSHEYLKHVCTTCCGVEKEQMVSFNSQPTPATSGGRSSHGAQGAWSVIQTLESTLSHRCCGCSRRLGCKPTSSQMACQGHQGGSACLHACTEGRIPHPCSKVLGPSQQDISARVPGQPLHSISGAFQAVQAPARRTLPDIDATCTAAHVTAESRAKMGSSEEQQNLTGSHHLGRQRPEEFQLH